MRNHYTTAVLELLESVVSVDEIQKGLLKVLKQKKHEKLLKRIWISVANHIEHGNDQTPRVTVAEGDLSEATRAQIDVLLKRLELSSEYRTEVDSSIIGGAVVETSTEIIDESYRSHLVTLYHSVTKT